MDERMIKIDNVSKQYRLGQIGGTTLRDELQRRSAKRRGKEDPTRKIGSRVPVDGETFLALDGISLEVKKGERVGIIGRNGAGKSTLLKLLSRVTAPSNGVIYLNGRVTSMLEVGTGFHPELTGRENIYMNGAILGMTRKEIDAKIEDIIEFSECRQFIDTPVKRYSSGMYVKLAFSVAAHLDSEIMIMDEVLAVGDMAFQQKCLTKMSDVSRAEGRTILYVSHNMNTIRQLCDRCIVLSQGKLVFDGAVEDAIQVYMDANFSTDTEIDYSAEPSPRWVGAPRIKLLQAAYLGCLSNSFSFDEAVNFRLKWKNLNDIENVSLRVEIWSTSDSPVATYVLYDFCRGKKDQTMVMDLSFTPEHFVEGKYYMYYVFFQRDSAGNSGALEGRTGLSFEITRARHTDKLKWSAKSWGNVVLDDLRLLDLQERQEIASASCEGTNH